MLENYYLAYIDDIIIFLKNRKEYRKYTKEVLRRLREAGLQCNIKKYEFEVKTTKYLGFIIKVGKVIRIDPEKVKAIQKQQAPIIVKGVKSFLGFTNFYQKFIRYYSDVVRPLTELTYKDKSFSQLAESNEAFKRLKRIFLSEPALAQFDYDKKIRVKTDSSSQYIKGTLLQANKDSLFVPCLFFSRKLNRAEYNYEIYDKEILAIVRSLEGFDYKLRGLAKFEVYSDYKNLEYFIIVRKLTKIQIRQLLTLSRYNFRIVYVVGTSNRRDDALLRRDQDLP